MATHKRPLSPPASSPPRGAAAAADGPTPTPTLPKFLTHTPLTLKPKFAAIAAHEAHIRASPTAIFRHPIAHARNRYPDIHPWAHNRVRLTGLPFDYINASRIELGDGGEGLFIATQGPVRSGGVGGAMGFWEMCWQEEVEVVVMLTRAVEEGREKCAVYYPEGVGRVVWVGSGDGGEEDEGGEEGGDGEGEGEEDGWGNVECVGLTESMRTEVRELKVTKFVGGGAVEGGAEGKGTKAEERMVWHFLFKGWPDMTVPRETTEFLELIKMTRFRIDGYGKDISGTEKRKEKPRVVHCSAGVGRTGTFIALDHLLQELDDGILDAVVGESGVDAEGIEIDPIFELVKKLREQRMYMVYQPSQYAFIYQVLREKWTAKKKLLQTPIAKGKSIVEEEGSPTKKRKGSEISFGMIDAGINGNEK